MTELNPTPEKPASKFPSWLFSSKTPRAEPCALCKRPPKKKITKPEWAMLIFLGAIFFIGTQGSKIDAYFQDWQRSLIQSDMVALAEQGKPDAILWVIDYVPDLRTPQDVEKIKSLADQGHAESMFRYSNYLSRKKDDAGSLAMLQKAADAGNPKAVMALYERKHP
jgi:hypothetical protein